MLIEGVEADVRRDSISVIMNVVVMSIVRVKDNTTSGNNRNGIMLEILEKRKERLVSCLLRMHECINKSIT